MDELSLPQVLVSLGHTQNATSSLYHHKDGVAGGGVQCSEPRRRGLTTWLLHLLTQWLCSNYLTVLNLSFLSFKIKKMPPIHQLVV